MEHLVSGPVPALLGLLLLTFILLLLLDINKVLGRIEEHLKEANDADPHVAHQRYLRQNDIDRP